MNIIIDDFVAGARAARGIAIIIDVFRACSLAPYVFAAGAATLIPVADIDQARRLKRQHPDYLLLGERNAQPPADFDGGNSPAQLSRWHLTQRTVLHTTHAGTQGLAQAMQADEVITGALVNAAAIVRYVQRRAPAQVTLVRMGFAARERCMEDDLCAELLAMRLRGESNDAFDTAQIRARLRRSPAAKKFFDVACQAYAPQADFDLCTDVDRFDFVLRLDKSQQPACLQWVAA